MKNGRDFVQRLRDQVSTDINTAALAKVERYENGRADITLFPDGDMILDVPVGTIQSKGFYIHVPLEKGDLVAVMFAQHETDGPLNGGSVDSGREKDINDAIIVAMLNTSLEPFPSVSPGSLVMGSKKGQSYIAITPDDKIEIVAPQGLKLSGKSKTEEW
jgi:hypothetical protein